MRNALLHEGEDGLGASGLTILFVRGGKVGTGLDGAVVLSQDEHDEIGRAQSPQVGD